jgi:hypothetical protein
VFPFSPFVSSFVSSVVPSLLSSFAMPCPQYLGEKLVLRNERIEAATLAFREANLLSGHGLGMDRANELDAVKAPRKGAPAKSSAQPQQEEEEEEGQQRPPEGVTGGAKSAGRADIEAPRVKSNPIAANAAGNLEGTL